MSYSDFRAYLKPKGSNPEIDSLFYELASYENIVGMWNCEVLTLGFQKGDSSKSLVFRPIERTKPIIFAINGISDGCYFVFVGEHTPGKKHDRMCNFKPFKTDAYLIDCYDGSNIGSGKSNYWAIKSEGITFVYGDVDFPDTWVLSNCDDLCAFIGGDLTVNELRANAWRDTREAVKAESREKHLARMASRFKDVDRRRVIAEGNLERAEHSLHSTKKSFESFANRLRGFKWPFVMRSSIVSLLKEYNK